MSEKGRLANSSRDTQWYVWNRIAIVSRLSISELRIVCPVLGILLWWIMFVDLTDKVTICD